MPRLPGAQDVQQVGIQRGQALRMPRDPGVSVPAPVDSGLGQVGEALFQAGERMRTRQDNITRVGEVARLNTFLNESITEASTRDLTDEEQFSTTVQSISQAIEQSRGKTKGMGMESAMRLEERLVALRADAVGQVSGIRTAQSLERFKSVGAESTAPYIQQAYDGNTDFFAIADGINRELNDLQEGGVVNHEAFLEMKRHKLAEAGQSHIMGIVDRSLDAGDIQGLMLAEDVLNTAPGLAAAVGARGQTQLRRVIQQARSSMIRGEQAGIAAQRKTEIAQAETMASDLITQFQSGVEAGMFKDIDGFVNRPGVWNQINNIVGITGESHDQVFSRLASGVAGTPTPAQRGVAGAVETLAGEQTLMGRARPGYLDDFGNVRPEDSSRIERMMGTALGGAVDELGRVTGVDRQVASMIPELTAEAENRLRSGQAEGIGEAVAQSLEGKELPRQMSFQDLGEQIERISTPDDAAARNELEQIRLNPANATGFGSGLVHTWNQTVAQVFPDAFNPDVARARENLGLLVGDFIRAERRSEGRIAVWEQLRLSRIFSDPSIWRSPLQVKEQLTSMDERIGKEIEKQKTVLGTNVPAEMKMAAIENIDILASTRERVRKFDIPVAVKGAGGEDTGPDPSAIGRMGREDLMKLDNRTLTEEQRAAARARWEATR